MACEAGATLLARTVPGLVLANYYDGIELNLHIILDAVKDPHALDTVGAGCYNRHRCEPGSSSGSIENGNFG